MDRLEGEEEIMKYPEKCPRCGGEVVEKEVKEVLQGGNHTALLTVHAGICLHCGERLYTPETVRQFEKIEEKLKQQDTESFQVVGTTFLIPS